MSVTRDRDIILEYGEDYRGQLFKAFVEPFVDVAKSATKATIAEAIVAGGDNDGEGDA